MIEKLCNNVIEIAKVQDDKNLIIDAYFLQAIALYRLYRPLEAVASFNNGKRVKARMLEASHC